MHVQLNTDNVITGGEDLTQTVRAIVESALDRFDEEITRVEVHLNDENSHKGGAADIRCMLEARIAGHEPLAVTDHAGDIEQAVRGASAKAQRALDSVVGRRREARA